MSRMDEQEMSDRLEELCGGPDGAFRLMRIYNDTKTYVETRARDLYLNMRYPLDFEVEFKKAAKADRYSDEAIAHYLKM